MPVTAPIFILFLYNLCVLCRFLLDHGIITSSSLSSQGTTHYWLQAISLCCTNWPKASTFTSTLRWENAQCGAPPAREVVKPKVQSGGWGHYGDCCLSNVLLDFKNHMESWSSCKNELKVCFSCKIVDTLDKKVGRIDYKKNEMGRLIERLSDYIKKRLIAGWVDGVNGLAGRMD